MKFFEEEKRRETFWKKEEIVEEEIVEEEIVEEEIVEEEIVEEEIVEEEIVEEEIVEEEIVEEEIVEEEIVEEEIVEEFDNFSSYCNEWDSIDKELDPYEWLEEKLEISRLSKQEDDGVEMYELHQEIESRIGLEGWDDFKFGAAVVVIYAEIKDILFRNFNYVNIENLNEEELKEIKKIKDQATSNKEFWNYSWAQKLFAIK